MLDKQQKAHEKQERKAERQKAATGVVKRKTKAIRIRKGVRIKVRSAAFEIHSIQSIMMNFQGKYQIWLETSFKGKQSELVLGDLAA